MPLKRAPFRQAPRISSRAHGPFVFGSNFASLTPHFSPIIFRELDRKIPNFLPMKSSQLLIFAASLGLGFSASHAAVSVVSPWHTAGNGSSTDYGIGWFNVPNLAIYHESKDAFGAGPTVGQMQIYASGFSDLHGISYSSSPIANVRVVPIIGWTGGVSLFGFQLGVFDTPRTVAYQIWNGDFSTLLASDSALIGATHLDVNTTLFSPNGFNIQFQSGSYVGIDNYAIEGGASAAPEPTAALLVAGTAAISLLRRRRDA